MTEADYRKKLASARMFYVSSILLLIAVILMSSWYYVFRGRLNTDNKRHIVRAYTGNGALIKEWEGDDIHIITSDDGRTFFKKSGKNVNISGGIVVVEEIAQ